MPLVKSKGNMYPWVSHTWNPIKGCQFGCDYCYVKHSVDKYGYDDRVRLDEEDLNTRLGKDKIIFVGSMGDMWGPWVPSEWIAAVVTQCFVYEWNEYYFQSKNPKRFDDPGLLPGRFIFGTTIETDNYPAGFKTKAPPILERWEAMLKLRGQRTFVTIEPIMDFRPDKLASMIYEIRPEFVNIGADSKGHGLVEPPWQKVELLISELNKFVEIRQKKNLDRLKR